jgi:hypothetical protein
MLVTPALAATNIVATREVCEGGKHGRKLDRPPLRSAPTGPLPVVLVVYPSKESTPSPFF